MLVDHKAIVKNVNEMKEELIAPSSSSSSSVNP